MTGDELDVRHGGLVVVDTESLRAAARVARDVARRVGESALHVGFGAAGLDRVDSFSSCHAVAWGMRAAADDAARVAEAAAGLATDVERAADLYELVELRVRWVAAAGDADVRAGIEARVGALRLGALLGLDVSAPAWLAFAALDVRLAAWRVEASDDLRAQALFSGWLIGGPAAAGAAFGLTAAAQALVFAAGGRSIRAGAVPAGAPRGAEVRVLSSGIGRAPTSLEAMARRVPESGAARVVIERYDMPRGDRQWVVYITGSQGIDVAEPFNLQENVPLYFGGTSASYEAVIAAMEDAGVRAGEPVHAVGHSQGAMIAANLAASGAADVRTLVTFGSPVVAELPPQTLVVDVRHTDDPVAALAGPGLAGGTGSTDSIVVQRLADPVAGAHDATVPAHGLDAYAETARRVDASADPRVDGLRGLLDRLAGASAVVVTQYGAERGTASTPTPEPSPSAQPAPTPRR